MLATLIVAAHFLRAGDAILALACVAALGLLLIKRSWVLQVGQVLLVSAFALWVSVAVDLIRLRQAFGEPWTRLAVILGAVALLNLFAAFMLRTDTLKRSYAPKIGPNLGKN